jgi:aspartyl-tRNA(Asn)/glutamyl-tRNA(Gln) amidotransferase subunit A
MIPLRDLHIVDLRALLKKKEISPEEIVRSCMSSIDANNETYKVFISVDPEGAISNYRKRSSQFDSNHSILNGIPIAIKDNVDVSGQVTTAGASFFKNNAPADSDASVIHRLKRAGAIALGKVNLHEFAIGATTANPHFGICKNPWNPECSPGGSSGGSGAAVALHMAPAALGTDTLGSIRVPSSFCGVVGLKPTYGLLPTDGVFPLAHSLDHIGPMARTVADVDLVFRAMLTYEKKLLLEEKYGVTRRPRFGSKRLSGLKIGHLNKIALKHLCHETTWQQYLSAFDLLADEGAEIVEESISGYDSAWETGICIALKEASMIHKERLKANPEAFGKDVRLQLEQGNKTGQKVYAQACEEKKKLAQAGRALSQRVDAWILPTTPKPAPKIKDRYDLQIPLFTGPICVMGLPSIAIPSGITADGLPVSIQIVSGMYNEKLLIDIAMILEERFNFSDNQCPCQMPH